MTPKIGKYYYSHTHNVTRMDYLQHMTWCYNVSNIYYTEQKSRFDVTLVTVHIRKYVN